MNLHSPAKVRKFPAFSTASFCSAAFLSLFTLLGCSGVNSISEVKSGDDLKYSVKAVVNYTRVTVNDNVELDAYATDSLGNIDSLGYFVKYEWGCGPASSENIGFTYSSTTTPNTTMKMPAVAQNGYKCIVRGTDDGYTASDTVKIDIILAPPTIEVANKSLTVRVNSNIALNAYASDNNENLPSDPGSIIKREWSCGTPAQIDSNWKTVSEYDTVWKAPSTVPETYYCIARVTDNDNNTVNDTISIKFSTDKDTTVTTDKDTTTTIVNDTTTTTVNDTTAKDTAKSDIVLTPPSIQITNRNITVREGYDIALNATASANNNDQSSDPGHIVKREWSCASSNQIEQNWKTVSVFDTVWKAPAPQQFICVARATDNNGLSATDTVNINISTEAPLIMVKDEIIYVNAGDAFELDASINNVWQGVDWFTWECKDLSGNTLENSVPKYDYIENGKSFRVGKDESYSLKGKDMNCIVSAQETSTKETFSDTTLVKQKGQKPVGVISAADTVYLWSGDETADDEAIYFYTNEWGGAKSINGDLGNSGMRDFWWRFDNVDRNYYQGNRDGSLDTNIAEFNTAFIRKTREDSITMYLDFRDSSTTTPTLEFYTLHRAKEVSHKVYFSKAWKNQGKDTVIAKTTSTVAPSLAIVNNVPILAYAESGSKVVISRLISGTWSKLGEVTTSSLKKLSAVAHGNDFYVGIIDDSGLTVHRSTSGTSAPAKVGNFISGIQDVKLISNGSGNPHAVVINSEGKIEMYDYSGSAWSINSKFGTRSEGSFSSFDAAVNNNGLVVTGVTSDYKLYTYLFSRSDFSYQTMKNYGSEIGVAKIALNGSKIYMVYHSRDINAYGTYLATGTLSSNNISWGSRSSIREGLIAYNVSLAEYNGTIYAAFDSRAAVSQIDVYRYESGKWRLHGENQLPYFNTVFYNRNNYYLRGLAPTLAFDDSGKLYLSMLAQESSTGSKNNNGPLVMKYVADNWKVKDWK